MPALYTSAKEGKQAINRQSPRDFSLVIADKILARVLLNRPMSTAPGRWSPPRKSVCLLYGLKTADMVFVARHAQAGKVSRTE